MKITCVEDLMVGMVFGIASEEGTLSSRWKWTIAKLKDGKAVNFCHSNPEYLYENTPKETFLTFELLYSPEYLRIADILEKC